MKSERWQQVQELFDGAADLAPAAQAAYLATACGGDAELRREVEDLLRSDVEAGTFIEQAIRRGSDLLLGAQPDPLESRGKVGKYEVLGRIGEGGFGVVYKGRDAVLQRFVALKTCSSSDRKLRRRFFREGQIAAGLQHPNITTVHDLGVENGVPYLVQEFLEGEDLHRKIARQAPLSSLQRLDILVQVARGLDHAHRQGVLHRDIKPANVRVLPDGGVKIMDFGIAKLLHEVSDVTTQGVTLGTVGYLAPEQLRGEAVDRRTDVFAFGVLAYELLSSARPFPGTTFSEVSYRLLQDEPRDLRDLAPELSPAIAQLVQSCLVKDAGRRCAGFADILRVLEPEIEALRSGAFVLGAGTAASAPPFVSAALASPWRRRRRWRRIGRWAGPPRWALAAATVAALAGATGWGLIRLERHPPAKAAAMPATPPVLPAPYGPGAPMARPEGPPGTPRPGSLSSLSPSIRTTPPSHAAAAPPTAGETAAHARARTTAPPAGVAGAAADVSAVRAAAALASPHALAALPAPPESAASPATGVASSAPAANPSAGERPPAAAATPFVGAAAPPAAPASPATPASTATAGAAGQSGALPQPSGMASGEPDAAGSATPGGEAADAEVAVPSEASASGPPRPMVKGDLIQPGLPGTVPPRLLSRPEPIYPDRARRRKAEADVLLLVLVDETGHVVRAIVKHTDDAKLGFNEAARQAALRATFAPATRDGLPGKMWTELPFSFRFQG